MGVNVVFFNFFKRTCLVTKLLYHIFSLSIGMYLSKYKHKNCSPNLVPVAKNRGSGSPPICIGSNKS